MKGKEIEEIGDSFRGLYMRNIADIIPNRSYLRSNADIPKLYAIDFGMPYKDSLFDMEVWKWKSCLG